MLSSLTGKRELLSSIPALQDPKWHTLLDDELNMCLSLENTVSFMSMAIGRHSDFHKTAKGLTLTPDLSLVYIDPIIDRVVKLCRESYEDIEITVSPSKLECFSTKIFTDASWLFDNMLCVITNAAKFTKDGTVAIHVSLVERNSAAIVQDFLRVEVHDSGDELDRSALDSFFSLFKARQEKVGGTGLGLYCLKCRVQALHGTCGVQKRGDRDGLVVWFEIPFIPEAAKKHSSKSLLSGSGRLLLPSNASVEDLAKEWKRNVKIGIISTESLSLSLPSNYKTWRVLFVDASEAGAVLADNLEQGRFDVTITDDITAALRKASQTHFDVIIVDHEVHLPWGGSPVGEFRDIAVRKLEEYTASSYSPVSIKPTRQLICLMGSSEDEHSITYANLKGADAFISRSSTTSEVESLVRSFFDGDVSDIVLRQQSSFLSLQSYDIYNPTRSQEATHVRFRSDIFDATSNKIPFSDTSPGKRFPSSSSDIFESIPAPSESASSVKTTADSKSVLIVDDSPTILNLLSRSLKNDGYSIARANNGLQALEILRVRRFDAVIMDQQMPFMDGPEAISAFRCLEAKEKASDERGKRPQLNQLIIAISANSDPECRRLALQSGANYFLSKPFAMSRFEEIIAEYHTLARYNLQTE